MNLLRRHVERLLRFRRWVVLAVIVMTGGFALAARNLGIAMDPEQTLPAHHPFVIADRAIAKEFGGKRYVVIALVPKQGTVWSVPVLDRIAALSLDLFRADGVRGTNLLSLGSPNARDIRPSGDSLDIEYLMRDPPRSEEEVQAVRAAYQRNPLYHGTLVSEDDRAAMILVDFWADTSPELAFQTVSSVLEAHRSPDIDIHLTGLPVIGHHFQEYARDMGGYFALALAAIMLVLYVAFGSLQGMLLPLSTGVLGTIWGLGLMNLSGGQLDGYNVMTPILILAVGAGHSVQMLKRYYEELVRLGDSDRAVVESTAKIGVVMIAAGVTAALGFLSLLTFDSPSLRAFGRFTALGILSVLVIELTFIPALRSMLPTPKERELRAERRAGLLDWLLGGLGRLILSPRGWLVPASAALLLLVSAIGMTRLEVNSTIKSMLPRDSVPRRDLEAIEQHFQGNTNMTVLLRSRDGSELKRPHQLAFIDGLQRELEKEAAVYRTTSIVELLKRMNMAMHVDDPTFNVLPKEADLIAQYLFLGYSAAFERFLDRGMRQAAVWIYLRTDDAKAIHRVIDRARGFVAAHAPPELDVLVAGGGGPTIVAVNDEVVGGKVRNVIVVSGVIYLIACLVFRSLVAGILVVTPLAIAVIANLGMLGLAGLYLNMITASVVGMAVGIGADYAIYLLYRTREEYRLCGREDEAIVAAITTSGKAVCFVALAVSAGYAVLASSPFAVYWMLGLTVPLTMIVSCGASVSVIPYLLARARPAFVFPRDLRKVEPVAPAEPVAAYAEEASPR